MLQKIYRHKVRIAFAMLFVVMLAFIRAFEDTLFYDPFLNYFKMDYYNLPLPEINPLKFFLGLVFRYLLNTILSLGIIYNIYRDFNSLKFASILYLIFFIILVCSFFIVLSYFGETNKMTLFYIRRFIIQPIFLLLFIPAFYYQKQIN